MKENLPNISASPEFEKYLNQEFNTPEAQTSQAINFVSTLMIRVQIETILDKAARWEEFVNNMGA